MDAMRNTLSLHSIKTRQIVYQDPSGSFPAVGGVLNVIDRQGHTDWTRDLSVNSVTLTNNISGPGRLTYSNTGALLLNGVPVGGGVTSVTAGPTGNITVAPNTGTVVVDLSNNISLTGSAMYVAVGDNSGGTTIRYSYDGVTWNNTVNAFPFSGEGVAYGNGIWVAVGVELSGKTIKYSTDGITWINAASGAFASVGRGIAYGNGQWVAVGDDSASNNTIKYSTDGSNWINASYGFALPLPSAGYRVAYGYGSNWVAVGKSFGVVPAVKNIKYSSDNGVTWADAATNIFQGAASGYGRGIAYGNGRWVAVGYDAADISRTIKYSTNDGVNWTNATSGTFLSRGYGVAYDGVGRWIAVGLDAGGNTIRVSTDNGVNWVTSTSGAFGNSGLDIGYINSRWFAVGDISGSTSTMKYSIDGGLTWIDITSGAFATKANGIAGIITSPSLQLVASGNAVGVSLDGPGQLVVSGSAGATTQIATPLRDVATGTAGVAGQVLTSAGAGLPPVWAAGGSGGVVLASRTYLYAGSPHTVTINAATFPGIPTTSPTTIRIYSQAGGGGGGGGWGLADAGGILSGGGGGGGGAGYVQDYLLDVSYGTVFTLTVGDGGNGGNGGNIFGPAATDGQIGGPNTIATTIGGQALSYVTPGGGGGVNGAGSSAGGGGDPTGDTAPVLVTGPFSGYNPGAKGGGLYGGAAGGGDGSVSLTLRNGGRGLAEPTHHSGAGGGGGGGGQGSNGENGGKGAEGFIRIDVYSG